ncbi:hypothetical protein QBC40DRAFT_43609 [Triangularia verruculosa]|uniref:LYR motif-containing protein Cup1-like N-terminal domain-containing protein n=1 Tax=Triangularia verruculosa TaxID=2587418 RepID=A0AAN6XPR6_9PEZI|nr:hypothetical protein QBC40DRAFT_43609 [Triangularia verruculosa]
MSRPLPLPPPTTTLGLYRHLLRESAYLPSLARPHVDQHIRDRFRRNQHHHIDEKRLQKKIKEAHHELRVFRAANAGDRARMHRILLKAFGRTGSRRRELFSNLIRRSPPATTDEMEAQISGTRAWTLDRDLDWLDGWDTEALMNFAKAQAKTSLPSSPRGPLLHKHLVAPEKEVAKENVYGKPFPEKVIRTKIKKMYAGLADRVLPPLLEYEWDKLALVAEGKFEEAGWFVPSRRPVAKSMAVDDDKTADDWKWQLCATKPVASVDVAQGKKMRLLTGAVDENTPYGNSLPLNRHVYTARFWQRLIKSIWLLSSKRTQNPEKGGYQVTWARAPFTAPTTAAPGMDFFESLPADAEFKEGIKGKTQRGRK